MSPSTTKGPQSKARDRKGHGIHTGDATKKVAVATREASLTAVATVLGGESTLTNGAATWVGEGSPKRS
jgi:hypothetical protein